MSNSKPKYWREQGYITQRISISYIFAVVHEEREYIKDTTFKVQLCKVVNTNIFVFQKVTFTYIFTAYWYSNTINTRSSQFLAGLKKRTCI